MSTGRTRAFLSQPRGASADCDQLFVFTMYTGRTRTFLTLPRGASADCDQLFVLTMYTGTTRSSISLPRGAPADCDQLFVFTMYTCRTRTFLSLPRGASAYCDTSFLYWQFPQAEQELSLTFYSTWHISWYDQLFVLNLYLIVPGGCIEQPKPLATGWLALGREDGGWQTVWTTGSL